LNRKTAKLDNLKPRNTKLRNPEIDRFQYSANASSG
jgi:hypothetical protein